MYKKIEKYDILIGLLRLINNILQYLHITIQHSKMNNYTKQTNYNEYEYNNIIENSNSYRNNNYNYNYNYYNSTCNDYDCPNSPNTPNSPNSPNSPNTPNTPNSSNSSYIIPVEQLWNVEQMVEMYRKEEYLKTTIDFINKINDKVNLNRLTHSSLGLINLNIIHKLDIKNTANFEIINKAIILVNLYNKYKNNNYNDNKAYYVSNQNGYSNNISNNSNSNNYCNENYSNINLPNVFTLNIY